MKPPNDFVSTAVRAGIFKILQPALRFALRDDDLAKVVTTADKFVENSVYTRLVSLTITLARFTITYHNACKVQERDVQKCYAIAWAALEHEFVCEQATLNG